MSDHIIAKFGEKTTQPQNISFYVFDESSDRALDFFNSFEYPEELDAAVNSGYASRVSADNAIEAYSVLRRCLFMVDSMLQAGHLEEVRYLIAETLSDIKGRETERDDTLIIE
jgi:hypothetical protein